MNPEDVPLVISSIKEDIQYASGRSMVGEPPYYAQSETSIINFHKQSDQQPNKFRELYGLKLLQVKISSTFIIHDQT